MTFAEKLKELRKRAGMSQEKLAERLGVSRQAVTKWETDTGIPELENIRAVSTLFGVSLDELLSEESSDKQADFLFESVTEYDLDEPKRFDIKLGGARRIVLSGCDGEKLRVRLASDTLTTLQSDLKVKIDDTRSRLDVDVERKNGLTEAAAKEAVEFFVQLPTAYLGRVELSASAEEVEVRSLECGRTELDVKAERVILDGVIGAAEINCNLDMTIDCRTLCGRVEVNQISASSRLSVPSGISFAAKSKGRGTSIFYERAGKRSEPFDTPASENVIELNGLKSELIICTE